MKQEMWMDLQYEEYDNHQISTHGRVRKFSKKLNRWIVLKNSKAGKNDNRLMCWIRKKDTNGKSGHKKLYVAAEVLKHFGAISKIDAHVEKVAYYDDDYSNINLDNLYIAPRDFSKKTLH